MGPKGLIGSLFYIFFIIEKKRFEEKRGTDIEKFPPNFFNGAKIILGCHYLNINSKM
jgi:hypothetical protein